MERAKLKLIGILVLVIAAIVLLGLNYNKYAKVWLFREFPVPVVLLVLITVGIGFAVGLLTAMHFTRRPPKKSA